MKSTTKFPYFLQGGGEMGKLIRAKDWNTTPLGDPFQWPQSLQTMVSVMLDNPFGMYIAWGKEFTQIYNDGYRPILGETKHPHALGNSTKETFSEIWTIIGSMFEGVMEGKPVGFPDLMLPLNRNGYVENCYFDFAYSPIRLDNGEVGGVLVTVIETTNKKKSEEHLKDYKSEMEFVIEASQLGTFDFDPTTNKFASNSRLKNWFGLPHVDQIDLSEAVKVIAEKDHDRVTHAIATSLDYASNGLLDVEYAIINQATKEEIIVHAKGRTWFTEEKKAYRLNGTVEEVTDKVLARRKIEESEQSIRALVESAPFPIGVYEGEELRITLANQSIMDVWGKGNDVVGKRYTDILPELANQQIFEQIRTVLATGIPFHAKNKRVDLVINEQLKSFYFNYSFTPILDSFGKVYGVMNTAAEVTELHEAKQKVEESEKRFRNSVEQAPLGIAIFRGPDFITEMANENYLLLIDKKEIDFIGKPLFKALPEVKDLVEPLFQNIVSTGEPFHATELPVKLDRYGAQEEACFNLVYHPLKEETGEISGIMVVATEVTATVKAKHLLEESERHFRSMVMQSPIPMAIFRGENFIVESANTAILTDLWRKKEKDVIGKSLLDIFPELKDQKFPELLKNVYSTGISYTEKEAVAFIEGDDGVKKFYLDFEYKALLDTEKKVSGIMVTAHDITDKVKARLEIQENEERLNIIIDASELGIWEYNVKEKQSITSKRCQEIFGVFDNNENVPHAKMLENIHPDDLGLREKAFKEAFKKGLLEYELRVIWKDGSIHWAHNKGKVFYDSENEPERIIGTTRDITEEKQFQQQLLEREEKFRLLADSMPQHIWTSDPQGNLNYFNQSVYDYSGLTKEEFDRIGWLEIVHPDDRESNIIQWTESIRTGKDFLLEHRFRKHDGEFRWQLSRAIPQKDEAGTITMWVGTSTDIQDQKIFSSQLEKQVRERTQELNYKNEDLEKMNKELQSFAYISSHDLQEPLRKIQTLASIISEKEYNHLSEAGKDKFHRIQKAANRMQTLIQDLLAYSRTNTQERIFETLNLKTIIDEVKEDLSEELVRKQGTIRLGKMCDVKVIPFQFRQLLFNLVSNALKFSKEEVASIIKINSEIGTAKKFKNKNLLKGVTYCHIEFSDNGIGFEQEFSEKIFVVFQRLHGKEQYMGTGIGLAIVKKIIENHQGFIFANGESNKGATFDIYIPF